MAEYADEVHKNVADYVGDSDWRIKENANTGKSYPNLLHYLAGRALATYGRDVVYTPDITHAHDKGYIHIHDLSGAVAGYCAGWSIHDFIGKGFRGNDTVAQSAAAKHVRSLCNHIVNFFGSMSNEWAGAQAFSSVDTVLAAYIASDRQQALANVFPDGCDADTAARMTMFMQKQVQQEVQSMIFHLNYNTRWGGQSPFTNMTLDLTVPSDLADKPAFVGRDALVQDGTQVTYSKLQSDMDLFNTSLFNIMATGDAAQRPFTFPVLTVNLTDDMLSGKMSPAVIDAMINATRKYGAMYFQNCCCGESNKHKIDPMDTRAMCCRLSLSITDLLRHTGGLFGAGDKTGSLGVVTLSLPIMAYEANRNAFSDANRERNWMLAIDHYFDLSERALELKRKEVVRQYNCGMFPSTRFYLFNGDHHIDDYPTHFSTIGYVGMHDALKNIGLTHGIVDEVGVQYAERIMDHLLERAAEATVRTGHLFNVEATPAEGASYRLAKRAVEAYPDMYQSGTTNGNGVFFTNSCHPPVELQHDLLFLLDHQDRLQRLHSGGTVVHLYTSGTLSDVGTRALIKKVSQTRIPYFSITPVVSICPVHGYVPGEHLRCPICSRLAAEYDAAHKKTGDPVPSGISES